MDKNHSASDMHDKSIIINGIDAGNSFNLGKTSEDYAKYRDIYPEEFYQYILNLGLCKTGQNCLDVGTGTGVIPRNMYKYGAYRVEQIFRLIKLAKRKHLPKKLIWI